MKKKIRSPVISLLGHVDHGKTTLVDKVRGTVVAKGEPGLITQHISASFVPSEIIRERCSLLLKKMGVELTIPGLLWIDSPGHEAFTTLRKRGGAIADLAILVIDVNEGFRPQTDESLNFLKQFKTPFIVAATKIDKMLGWNPVKDACFLDTERKQNERARGELEEKLYRLVGQLSERGFEADRFDRIDDFSKRVAIVPVSGVTGEGIADLLVVLGGIAQKYLKRGLEITPGEGKGAVLEVKEFRGLGVTLDAIIYDGEIRKGDWLVIGGREPVKTRIKALLKPSPLKELKSEKAFQQVESATAAAALKIAAPDLESVMAGSPLRAVRDKKDIEKAVEEVQEEIEEVEIETEKTGAILKADTLGSLEALTKSLKGIVPIRKAEVGNVTKSDIMEVRNFEEPKIFLFGLAPAEEVKKLAKDNNVALFHSNVIYSLLEDYEKWQKQSREREEERILMKATHPCRMRVLKGFVFRQKKPAVFGVEIEKGTIRPGYRLLNKGKSVGEVKEVQMNGENVDEAKKGDKVAISMPDVTIGKNVSEGDVLEAMLTPHDKEMLEKVKGRLRADEIELLGEGE